MASPALGSLGLFPREVRDLIYDFFLKDHWSKLLQRVRIRRDLPRSRLIRGIEMIRRMAITTTSRELRREVLETFLSTNEFCEHIKDMLVHLVDVFSKDIDVVAHSRQLGLRHFSQFTRTHDLYTSLSGDRRWRTCHAFEIPERNRILESLRTCQRLYQIPARRLFIRCHYGLFLHRFFNDRIKSLPEHQHFPVCELSRSYAPIEARVWMGDESASVREVNDMVAWCTVYLQSNLERMLAHLKKHGQDLSEAEYSDLKHRLINDVSNAITLVECTRDYHLTVIGEMMEFWYPDYYGVAEFFSMARM